MYKLLEQECDIKMALKYNIGTDKDMCWQDLHH